MYDLIIIGGGASGLALANVAKKRNKKILVFDAGKKVGRKILVAGNGKCNVSNESVKREDYNNDFVEKFLPYNDKVYEFFKSIGLTTRSDEGRIYPYSESANTVLNLLRKSVEDDIVTDCKIDDVEYSDGVFIVNGKNAKNVAVCTGGITAGGTGSYNLLEKFGHKKTALYPVLSALRSDVKYVKQLAGIRVKARVTLLIDGERSYSEYGELLFKDNGISGIVSMALSRYISPNKRNDVSVDLAVEYTAKELKTMQKDGLLQKAVLAAVEKQAADRKISVESCIKDFIVSNVISGDKQNAQVTRGGIDTKDFTEKGESKFIKGLYACGEVLDVDGRCGGYNMHWAFLTGIIAGENV